MNRFVSCPKLKYILRILLQNRINYSYKQQINAKTDKMPLIIILSIDSNTGELMYRHYPI